MASRRPAGGRRKKGGRATESAAPRSRRPSQAPPPEPEGRDRILQAAIRSFAEKGFDGTTTAGVARAAGVTQPLVYHHFASKDDLWRAAVDHLYRDEPTLFPEEEGIPPEERVLVAAERFARLAAAIPGRARIVAQEGAVAGPRLSYIVERHCAGPIARSLAALKAGQRAGTITREVDPRLLILFVIGAVEHIFDVPALAREAFGIDVHAKETQEAIVRLVREVLCHGVLRGPRRRS